MVLRNRKTATTPKLVFGSPRGPTYVGKAIVTGLLLFQSLTVTGCGNLTDQAQELTSIAVLTPETWMSDGQTWTRGQSLTDADQQLLTRFFQMNPDCTGSLEFEGSPAVFCSGKSNRRFVWTRTTFDGSAWILIEFVSGRVCIKNGTGVPWGTSSLGNL